MNSTIAAIATAPGRGAIAIIRISGPGSLRAYKTLTNKKTTPTANIIKPAWIYDGTEQIDQSMLVYFRSPNSFTGEDMLEIHCHGSTVVQNSIMRLLNSIGIVPAKPGEFSERAYYNGKIDVAQAEAIMELVASENSNIARLASRQLAGEFSKKINNLRNDIASLAAAIAADLDFSEEDTPMVDSTRIKNKIGDSLRHLRELQAHSEILPKLREGVHVALVGLPNAGKSTLLNKLLGYDRSIVTDVAGTTRDTISESLEIGGVNYHFTDTAGLNDRPDKIEKIGIDKTIAALISADIILLLIEPGKDQETNDYLAKNNITRYLHKKKLIVVNTKSDISKESNNEAISAKTGEGIDRLIKKITSLSSSKHYGNLQILTTRQLNILNSAEQGLVKIYDNSDAMTNDIISAELQSVISNLNELTGEHASKQIIESIFRNFCIGK